MQEVAHLGLLVVSGPHVSCKLYGSSREADWNVIEKMIQQGHHLLAKGWLLTKLKVGWSWSTALQPKAFSVVNKACFGDMKEDFSIISICLRQSL